MSEETKYLDGDIVWVKLQYCWWPGEVISLDKVPSEVRESFKLPPLAVVRFFQEDTFEYIKSGHGKNICSYTSEKKNAYIKKGMDMVRSKSKAALMAKFPADVCTAERLSGGNPNILNEFDFAEQPRVNPTSLIFESSSSSASLKRRNSSSAATSGGTPRGRGRGRPVKAKGNERMSTGSMDNKFFSMSSPKKSKPNKEIIVTHPRFINDDIDDHEVVELIQTKGPSIEAPATENLFICIICGFKTGRVDVLVMHRETHSQKPIKRKFSSPRKPRKVLQMPRSKTKTLEEDLALVRSGKTVEDFLSDDEIAPKRTKKSTKKTSPKISKAKKEETPVLAVKDANKEEIKKIDREQLVAEWNEIEESEDEAQENIESKVEEKKSDINDSIKSCFDFDEDDSEEISTTVEGRKIPTVIPDSERPQSPKIELVPDTENTDVAIPSPQAPPIEPIIETPKEDETVRPDPEITAKESPPAEETYLDKEVFETLLQSTSVPELPDVPQIREKCEQNFHDTRTIKFPDKSDPEPIQIDNQETNGLVDKTTSDNITPISESSDVATPIVVPVKTEVATKLTNPKKRFVRSFQEEKAKVQDRLDKLEQEKLSREKAQAHDNELIPTEIPARIQHAESKVEDLPQKNEKIEEPPLPVIVQKKRHHHTSKKIERKSKYKPKRRGHHVASVRKVDSVTNIVNSLMDDKLDEKDDKEKSNAAEAPTESYNISIDSKSNGEKQDDVEPITDHNDISNIVAEQEPIMPAISHETAPVVTVAQFASEDEVEKEATKEFVSEPEKVQQETMEVVPLEPITAVIQDSVEIISDKPIEEVPQEPLDEIPPKAVESDLQEQIDEFPQETQEHSTEIPEEPIEALKDPDDAPDDLKDVPEIAKEILEDPKIPEDPPETPIEYPKEVSQEPNECILRVEKECIQIMKECPQLKTDEFIKSVSDSNQMEFLERPINNVPAQKSTETDLETNAIVDQVPTVEPCDDVVKDAERIKKKRFPKSYMNKIMDIYESNDLRSLEKEKETNLEIDTNSEIDYCTTLPTSLPESPKSEDVALVDNLEETESKKSGIEEPELSSIITPEVQKDPDSSSIDNNVISTNELNEPSILINTGNHNSEELSALNTLATLSEMIQPEFDVRSLRNEESLLSSLENVKEIDKIPENILGIDEKVAEVEVPEKYPNVIDEKVAEVEVPEKYPNVIDEKAAEVEVPEKYPNVIDEQVASVGIESAEEVNESIPKIHEDVPEIIKDIVDIPENVPEINETVPEVLDKITVFPDEQLVKGQMEIVTLTALDPMSNDSSKTDMELENINENVSVIAETKVVESKSFIVNEPESVNDYKELTTDNKSVLEKQKIESSCSVQKNENIKARTPDRDEVNAIEKDASYLPTARQYATSTITTITDDNLPSTNKNNIVLQETPKALLSPNKLMKNKHKTMEPIPSNRNIESGVIVSHTDTLAAAIANTIESEMAKLTDTALDVAMLPIQQKETSNSKLLEILSESKFIADKPKKSQMLLHQLEGQMKPIILNRTGFSGASKPSNKTIILSDQVIKPARNETDSVVVQKVSNKRTLEDFEDIDAYIIQKPSKKATIKSESELAPPTTKLLKKSSPRSRPRILQQTIITAAGDVIQPDGPQVDDQSMFDINSMPIVLSDQILTPESIESMPMILQDSPQTSKVVQAVKATPQTLKLLNKTPTESVIKSPPKAIIRGYHKAPQRIVTAAQKKGVVGVTSTTPTTQVKTNYILVPSTGSPTSASTVPIAVNRKSTIKRQGSQLLLQTTKLTTPTTEPTGNKIMIFTNNLGQQQRVVLTPAQQKMFMPQNSNKLKTTTASTATSTSKIVKVNARPNILAHPKSQLISTSTSSGQTILLAPTQMITPLTPQQMKTATKVAPTKLKVTKYVHNPGIINQQQGNLANPKTIIIKNQQGHTVKKIQGNTDADLDRQVAEQIEAIKAAEAIKTSVKANQPAIVTSKEPTKIPVKHMPVKKLIATVKPQQQQQQQQQQLVQQQRKSVVRKTFTESARSLALTGTAKVSGVGAAVPPLTPLIQQPHQPSRETIPITPTTSVPSSSHTLVSTTEKKVLSSTVATHQVNSSPEKDSEKRQLVMQDDQGNMSAIPVGQILAIPNETIDGQAQSYMLVTMDETGNLIPINQETLMSIDPNILGNMVVQNDQGPPKTELEEPKSVEKEPTPAVMPQEIPENVTPITETLPQPECIESEQSTLTSESPNTLLPAEVPTNLHTTTCNINNGDVNKQVVITGDPVVTQKFLESLAGNQELFNLLANAEGNLLIHADGQQILINTSNTPVENTMLDQPESGVEDRNPVMSNPSTKNHDILAAALADTDVIPNKLPPSQLSPGTSLYPLHSSNVLETSAMNSPIMTPLEVTETHSKKIDDILGQVPKSVSDLPITITDPNIAETVAQQQLSNDIHASLELPLNIPDNTTTSVGMNSPSFSSYSLPNLDEDITQKPFSQSISMPLLTDEPEEPIATTEERTTTTDSLTDVAIKMDTTSAPSTITTKEEYVLVDRMCSVRTSRICSSLSEPPPDMFDYAPVSAEVSENMHETKVENDSLLQKVTAAMKKAIEELPCTQADNDNISTDVEIKMEDDSLIDITVKEEDKLDLSVSDSDKLSDIPIDMAEVDRTKIKEELFEPNLTSQFHSPSTNTDDSCEIPVQPPIVTTLDEKLDDAELNESKSSIDNDESENENKNCKLT